MPHSHPCVHLIVVGLGNIGSQLVPLIALLPWITHVSLVDFDHYETGNFSHQRTGARDVGRAKAKVQARVLATIRPDLAVLARVCRFEAVPLGLLRDGVILSCVDSRAARQSINAAAVAMDIPWIDAATAREGSVRARAYLPGHGGCLECAWGLRDYALLEQRAPCAEVVSEPTAAAPELGAIAAGLQVTLLRRLHADPSAAEELAGRQWHLDVPSGKGWCGVFARNEDCRLDHRPWRITALGSGSCAMTLREALGVTGEDPEASALVAPGMVFVRRLHCPKCQRARRFGWRLSGRIARAQCGACGVPMLMAGVDSAPELRARHLTSELLREPLTRRGFVPGDVFLLRGKDGIQHFQLG